MKSGNESLAQSRRHVIRNILWALAGVGAVVLFLCLHGMRTIKCGLGATYAEGTIVALPFAVVPETNPHSTQPDYRPGRTPIIRLDGGNGKEIPADPQQGPSSRGIGERVEVCYDPQHPEQVHILNAALRSSPNY